MQHFLYFESHTKSLKLLHIIVCISSAFTISTYFINECMYLDEISRKQLYRVYVQTAQTEGTLHFRGCED